jgi:hypothetical protein
MIFVCREPLMVVEALLRPKWEVVADVLTCFVHGPTKDIYHMDIISGCPSVWAKATYTTVDFSRSEEHH